MTSIGRSLLGLLVFAVYAGLLIVASGRSVNCQEIAPGDDTGSTSGPTAPSKAEVADGVGEVRVTFDDSPGVVVVEAGGRLIRIDSNARTVRDIGPAPDRNPNPSTDEQVKSQVAVAENAEAPAGAAQSDDDDIDPFYYEPGYEPYDYRLINVPTPKSVPKGSWNLSFSHRFAKPIHPISGSARELFGLDSFSISSFGIAYGVTDKFYLSAQRNPICTVGLCRTIEIGAGYHFLDQKPGVPVALSVYGSIEGDGNFTERYTGNAQIMVGRRLGKRVHLFFSPAVHFFSNGGRRFDPRPGDFFPPAQAAEDFRLPKHTVSFGFGAAVAILPDLLATFDFTPRLGFKLGRVRPVFDESFNIVDFRNFSEPSIGFGVQKNIGKHAFALTFSNTQTTTTSRYNSSNLLFSPRRLTIGFNLFRRF